MTFGAKDLKRAKEGTCELQSQTCLSSELDKNLVYATVRFKILPVQQYLIVLFRLLSKNNIHVFHQDGMKTVKSLACL